MFNQFVQQPFTGYVPQGSYASAQQQSSNVSWLYVNGIDGARSQIVQPGNTAWMMDNNDPIIYVKAVDAAGTSSLRSFRLNEIPAPNSGSNDRAIDLSDYASKTEINAILKRLEALEHDMGGTAK